MNNSPVMYTGDPEGLDGGVLVMGLEGWMDGGEVSTGAVSYLEDVLDAEPLAEIDPEDFYLLSFPGTMETASEVRPTVEMDAGLVTYYEEPLCRFSMCPDQRLVLFEAREPNLRWGGFTEALFSVLEQCRVRRVFFAGSVAGLVPHTRDPRFHGSASSPELVDALRDLDIRPSEYSGPASFVSRLLDCAPDREIEVVSLVAEMPAYVQGRNPRCIAAALRMLMPLAGIRADLAPLDEQTREFLENLDGAVLENAELSALVHKLENEYDRHSADESLKDIKQWFERQHFRIDPG
jgi:hypothetical protein